MTLKSDAKLEEKLTLGYKNDMRNLANFNVSSGSLSKYKFGEISHRHSKV